MPQWFKETQTAVREAVLFTGDNALEIQEWAHIGLSDRAPSVVRVLDYARCSLLIRNKRSHLTVAVPGDWVVKGEFGFYAMDPEEFAEKFLASK